MSRKITMLVLCLLLIIGYENCKTFAGADQAPSVWGAIANDQQFSIFRDFLQTAGWADKLDDKNASYTLMAPTNNAFLKLGDEKLAELKKTGNSDMLRAILEKHIFKGSLDKESLVNAKTTPASMEGKSFPVQQIKNKWYIGNAHPTKNPLITRNGMFYVLDTVLE
jgi:transforming growth factor-beta-induced protein